ncbi:MAG: four helix bundle protein [Clostridia bacterium]|nr:four helix bundle protein [Clostridia bacterium]MBR3865215.1 four helix bundle protein [Clostridia bacterium]
MKENKLVDLSMDFAISVIQLCENIKGHYSLTNQLERSATSIGANIREANYAHGKADFIAKLQISLKECYETEFWLELFVKSGIAPETAIKTLYDQCGTLRRLLIASINTAKKTQP